MNQHLCLSFHFKITGRCMSGALEAAVALVGRGRRRALTSVKRACTPRSFSYTASCVFIRRAWKFFRGKIDVMPHMCVLPEIKTIKYVIVEGSGTVSRSSQNT